MGRTYLAGSPPWRRPPQRRSPHRVKARCKLLACEPGDECRDLGAIRDRVDSGTHPPTCNRTGRPRCITDRRTRLETGMRNSEPGPAAAVSTCPSNATRRPDRPGPSAPPPQRRQFDAHRHRARPDRQLEAHRCGGRVDRGALLREHDRSLGDPSDSPSRDQDPPQRDRSTTGTLHRRIASAGLSDQGRNCPCECRSPPMLRRMAC
jgi:hypothetical protein